MIAVEQCRGLNEINRSLFSIKLFYSVIRSYIKRSYCHTLYVLLKALLPVCMKYTARGESRVANIARGEASTIFVMRPSPICQTFLIAKLF